MYFLLESSFTVAEPVRNIAALNSSLIVISFFFTASADSIASARIPFAVPAQDAPITIDLATSSPDLIPPEDMSGSDVFTVPNTTGVGIPQSK